MKKFISMLLAITIFFSSHAVVFAESTAATLSNDIHIVHKSFYVVDEWYQAEYHLLNDEIVYAKIVGSEYTVERINDESYLNGEKTLSMSYSDSTGTIKTAKTANTEPRAGWLDVLSCPYGTADEYNNIISYRKKRNIDTEQDLYTLSIEALSIILIAYYPLAEFSVTVAKDILNAVVGTAYERYDYVHFYETIKSHDVVGHSFRKVELEYYLDEEFNNYQFTDYYFQTRG